MSDRQKPTVLLVDVACNALESASLRLTRGSISKAINLSLSWLHFVNQHVATHTGVHCVKAKIIYN